MNMKKCFAMVAIAMCLGAPPTAAQIFSWDPLKDVQEALPGGVPSEAKIMLARHQVREMSQDALASLYEIAPATRRTIERSAGYAVFSTFRVKLFFAGGTARHVSVLLTSVVAIASSEADASPADTMWEPQS